MIDLKGALAEWLCSGLQIRGPRFDSGTRLHILEEADQWSAFLYLQFYAHRFFDHVEHSIDSHDDYISTDYLNDSGRV